jgi:hypothetical protein
MLTKLQTPMSAQAERQSAKKEEGESISRNYTENKTGNVQQSSSDKILMMKSFSSLRTAAVRLLNSRVNLLATSRPEHIPLASGVELEGVGDWEIVTVVVVVVVAVVVAVTTEVNVVVYIWVLVRVTLQPGTAVLKGEMDVSVARSDLGYELEGDWMDGVGDWVIVVIVVAVVVVVTIMVEVTMRAV